MSSDNNALLLRHMIGLGPAVSVSAATRLYCVVGMSHREGLFLTGCMHSGSSLFLSGMDGGGLSGGGLDCAVSNFPAGHPNETAFEESASRTGSPRYSSGAGCTSAPAQRVPGEPRHCGNAPGGNHDLGQHGAAGPAHIDAQSRHEAVDFLGYLEKSDCAQKPNQYISSDSLLAGCRNRGLHLTFLQSKDRSTEHKRHQCGQGQQTNDFLFFRMISSC